MSSRERLLDAAAALFARHGYHGTSLADVCARAGLTTGAVYSNFRGKGPLFVACVQAGITHQITVYAEAMRPGDEPGLRAAAGRWLALLDDDPAYFPLFVEAWRMSLVDAEIRASLAAAWSELAATVAGLATGVPAELRAEAAIVVLALGNGLALHRQLDPGTLRDDLLADTLALLQSAVGPRPPGPEVA